MNENFNEIENCFNSSLKVTEICVSLMEAKLALRGYEPLIVGLSKSVKYSSICGINYDFVQTSCPYLCGNC